VHFLIPAAGSGSRMKAGKNKLLIDLEGESLIYRTLKSVFSASSTNWVGIIGQPKDKNLLLNSAKDFAHKVHWINGGDTRQQSVFNGLKALPKDAEKVLIHDGARCLINPELIDLCAKQLDENEAVILSMTKKERTNPKIIDGSRKKRIANGSGTDIATINKLLKQFKMMSEMMKKMSKGNMKGMADKGIPPELFNQLK